MSLAKFAARRRGFTLIELLIVIVVIAILALIVIPKLMGASRKAKDSTLRANLHILRSSVENFHADTGCYPAAFSGLTATAGTTPAAISDDGTTVAAVAAVPAGTYKGPYLTGQGGIDGGAIPVNPYVKETGTEATDVAASWNLEIATAGSVGNVTAKGLTGNDAEGNPYANY